MTRPVKLYVLTSSNRYGTSVWSASTTSLRPIAMRADLSWGVPVPVRPRPNIFGCAIDRGWDAAGMKQNSMQTSTFSAKMLNGRVPIC